MVNGPLHRAQPDETALSATPIIIVAVGFLCFMVFAIIFLICRDECRPGRGRSKYFKSGATRVSIEMSVEESIKKEQQELNIRALNALITKVNDDIEKNNNSDCSLKRSVSTIQATVHANLTTSMSTPGRACRQCSDRTWRTPALASSRLFDEKIIRIG